MFAVTIGAATLAQAGKPYVSVGEDPIPLSRSYACPDGAVFSQVPSTVNNAYYCQDGYDFYLVATNFLATGSFTNFRLWGGDYFGCTLDATEEFEVTIWDDDPSNGGTEVFSGTFDGTTFDTGEIHQGTRTYQIDIDLGTVINQTSGYIGVTRNNSSGCLGFAWVAYGNGSGHRLSYGGNNWVSSEADLLFCLSYEEPVALPITNWALYLSAILIGLLLFIRIRKIM